MFPFFEEEANMADDILKAGSGSEPANEGGTNFIHAIIEKDQEEG